MGAPSFVFHHIHPMLGADFENCIIPPAPAVVPATPYVTVTILSGNLMQSKYTKKTFALMEGITIMQKGTDCGYLGVPHFGNPVNALYPLILGMSKSKSHFGVATVKMEGEPVATAIIFIGVNLNCGTISTPTGLVLPPTTVFAGMSIGDFVAGVFNIVVDMVWDKITQKIFGATKIGSKVAETIVGKIMGKVFIKIFGDVGEKISKEVVKRLVEKLVKKYVFEGGIKAGVGKGTGSEKGKSVGQAVEDKVRDEWHKHFDAPPADTF